MYTEYRRLKWQEVQACINAITGSEGRQDNLSHLPIAVVEEEHEGRSYISTSDTSSSEDENSLYQPFDETLESEDDEDMESDVYRSDGGYDMDTVSRALCVDSCELYRAL